MLNGLMKNNIFGELGQRDRILDHLLHESRPDFRNQVYPRINLWGNEEETVVTAEVPGIDMDNIELTVQKDLLHLSVSPSSEMDKTESTRFHRNERYYSNSEREIKLPFYPDSKKINAKLKDGILYIHLQKRKEDLPVKIKVKSA